MCYEFRGWLRTEKRSSSQQDGRKVTPEATSVQAPPEPVKPAEAPPRVREEEKIPA